VSVSVSVSVSVYVSLYVSGERVVVTIWVVRG
jgi:hypothetical protein